MRKKKKKLNWPVREVRCEHCGYNHVAPFPKDFLCAKCSYFLSNLYDFLKRDIDFEIRWNLHHERKERHGYSSYVFKKVGSPREIPLYEVCLISEDHSTVQLIKSYFDSKQFKVYDFVSCLKAWQQLKRQNPMVILMDRSLPEVNRKKCLERLESDKKLKNIPVKIFRKSEYKNKNFPKYRKQDQTYNEDIVDFFKF